MKETKEAAAFLFALHMAFDKAQEDGKVDVADLGLLIDPIGKALPAIQNLNLIEEEIKNATDEQLAEFKTWVKASYDIADDALEAKVEEALSMLPIFARFVYKVGA